MVEGEAPRASRRRAPLTGAQPLNYMAATTSAAHDLHGTPGTTEPGMRRASEVVVWVIAIALAATFLAVRLRQPWVFEYEAAETAVASAAFVEHGTLPRAYHRIRYTPIYTGPLHAYLKAIPYLFTLDPGGEVLFLNLLNAFAAVLLFFLLRRLFGLGPAALAIFLLAFSVPSIERCTAVHVRCYSVPLVLIVMVLAARVLLLRQHRLMPVLAVALAFATQVYGFATFFLPPGLVVLFLLYRPPVPARTWRTSGAIFAVLQIPWILDDVWRGVAGPVFALQHGLFTFPAQDVQDIDQARADALSFIGSITKEVLFDDATMIAVGVVALSAMVGSAVALLVRRRKVRENYDLFFVLWLVMFLVLPAYLGAGARVYLAQFLGPVIVARGLTLGLDRIRSRPLRLAARALGAVAAGLAIVLAVGHLAGPRPTTILSDPAFPQSLQEIRAVVRHVHERGLGRIGFNQRVHGAMFQADVFADSYLFWTVCHHDAQVPCSAGAEALPASTHFAALGREFPFRPAEGTVSQFGTVRLVEYESRLRLPFQAIAFPVAPPAAEPTRREHEWFAGPPNAVRSPATGTTPSEEADRFAALAQWPPDRPGVPAYPIRRASQVVAVMMDHDLDPAFADEARYPGPDGSSLELVLRGTLEIDRIPDSGKELHLFLTTVPEGDRCRATILVDGVRVPQSRFDERAGSWGHPLLMLDADTTGFLQPGRHLVTVRLRDCSAERYDLYDLVVWPNG